MSAVHSMQGVGALVVEGERHGGVHYLVEIHREGRHHLVARGSLTIPDGQARARGALMRAFTLGAAELELQRDGSVQIVPNHYSIGVEPPGFAFVVNGPVPGFGERPGQG